MNPLTRAVKRHAKRAVKKAQRATQRAVKRQAHKAAIGLARRISGDQGPEKMPRIGKAGAGQGTDKFTAFQVSRPDLFDTTRSPRMDDDDPDDPMALPALPGLDDCYGAFDAWYPDEWQSWVTEDDTQEQEAAEKAEREAAEKAEREEKEAAEKAEREAAEAARKEES